MDTDYENTPTVRDPSDRHTQPTTFQHSNAIYDDLDQPNALLCGPPGNQSGTSDYDTPMSFTSPDPNRYMTLSESRRVRQADRKGPSVLHRHLGVFKLSPITLCLCLVISLIGFLLAGAVGAAICKSVLDTRQPINTSSAVKLFNNTVEPAEPSVTNARQRLFLLDTAISRSYFDARFHCNSQGHVLVRIEDPETDVALSNFMVSQGVTSVWIDFQFGVTLGCGAVLTCDDIRLSDLPTYTNWATLPNVSQSPGVCTCTEFTPQGWRPQKCGLVQHFVCEKLQ